MGNKLSPSRIKFKAERKARREKDPVVQEKARKWAELRGKQNGS